MRTLYMSGVSSSLLTNLCSAALTVHCQPVIAGNIGPGIRVDVECLVTSDFDQTIKVSQVDLPCTLPAQAAGNGEIVAVSASSDLDGDGIQGPSSKGFPYLYGPTGLFMYLDEDCILGGILAFGTPVMLPADETRYLGTVTYEVSECAGEDFTFLPENFTNPPLSTDGTRFRDGLQNLIPLTVVSTSLTVNRTEVGCCYSNAVCLNVAHDCCLTQGGIPAADGSTCGEDFDGDGLADFCDSCPIDPFNDSDGVCDSDDLCPGEDDTIDAENDQVLDCLQKIPTVSAWGLIVLALLIAIAGKIAYSVRHRGFA